MRLTTLFAILAALTFSGCVTRPYDGRSVVKEGEQLVCGLHRIPVEAHEGYIFNGLITFVNEESMNFGTERYPNTLGATFTTEESEDYSLSFTDYTCTECQEGYRRLEKLPMWYKRIVGWPAKLRRDRQLERAAAKAERTGNPDDAKVPDGDGYLSRMR
jgi:hypothetical protein